MSSSFFCSQRRQLTTLFDLQKTLSKEIQPEADNKNLKLYNLLVYLKWNILFKAF